MLAPTCILSMESDSAQALEMRYVCSMYSLILCRKLSGSLNTMGMVILDSSCNNTTTRSFITTTTRRNPFKSLVIVSDGLTSPIHFFRMLHTLKLFLENILAGRVVLRGKFTPMLAPTICHFGQKNCYLVQFRSLSSSIDSCIFFAHF